MSKAFASLSAQEFQERAAQALRRARGLSAAVENRRFQPLFGVSPALRAVAWNLMGSSLPRGPSPRHLLWALLFLKVYATEHVSAIISGVDEKTFRKWSWEFAALVSALKVVSRSQRASAATATL